MRNKFLLMFLFLAISGPAAAWDDSLTADSTFSIIARDIAAGELGMAVQSKAHAVGSRTISARGGLAVIAHQAVSNPMYGQIGLELLQRGYSPQQALDSCCAATKDATAGKWLSSICRGAQQHGRARVPRTGKGTAALLTTAPRAILSPGRR